MKYLVYMLFAFLAILCLQGNARDYDEIKKSGFLRVLTVYQAEPEMLHREMSPEDYEISLLENFAREEKLELHLINVLTYNELLADLAQGKGDLAASMLTITPERKKLIDFSTPFLFSVEQLVGSSENKSFKNIESLAGHSIHVQPGTSYEKTAEALGKKINGLSVTKTPEQMEQEAIFMKLISGEYEYTIADESYVRSFQSYNDGIRDLYSFPEKKEIAFGLQKNSPKLLSILNEYIRKSVPFHQVRVYKEDLPELKKRGYIRILTRNNPYSYYLHNGVLMGFEYELAREFAKRQGLHPVFVVPPDWNDLIPWLIQGRGEIVAACMSITEKRMADNGVVFCAPYCTIKEQIIGRKKAAVKSFKELAGRSIAVRKSSSYWEIANSIKDSGIAVNLVAVPEDIETFEILDRVEDGSYDLTICDDNIASLELKLRPGLAAFLTLPTPKNYGWLVRESSPLLKTEVNKFFTKEQKSSLFNVIYAKYFRNEKAVELARQAQAPEESVQVLNYDKFIKKYSERYSFHWCLIGAQILQESRFNPDAVSSSGARGLMQIMPGTAEHMGFKSIEAPEQNIHAGTKYLYTLRERSMFASLKPFDRLCFALASYNGGLGHLLDARQIAANEKMNPNVWLDNVEKAFALLAQEKYSRKTRYGACRTSEIISYVRNIIFYYRMYLREYGDFQPGSPLPQDAMP
ncbi:MAG: hypothetical protein A2X49_15770 [Lentisphaerae bacterium GWF2_52_8]|nr:MAG: hypothetical protein A2X49_15770 [Lentisphaerae bacterium GWF2_52_8]